ncbi:uncharacterized protein LOC131235342 isoform X8 [Magnolia sinica]|uniref:uncharacterized protein LOC131235342 isoform X8 n=1 Tax=Magnolia sinica TaxID=86752 RepID=UPI00265AABE5|nr:uncharacterized protein LOC131235342 isoform X8 [Magnolia sinica]
MGVLSQGTTRTEGADEQDFVQVKNMEARMKEDIIAETPAEVHASLKAEGYNIEYKRIPLTREREALLTDIDAIHSCQDEYVSCIRQLATIICFTIWRLLSFCVTHWLWVSC